MKTSKHEDMETLEQQVHPWLERTGTPIERYRNLPLCDKVSLHDAVYAPTQPPSDAQLRDLYRKLALPKSRVTKSRVKGYSADAVNSVTSEELQKFFSPLTPSEKLHYLEKY